MADFFEDDPFEEIVREFFGHNGISKQRPRRETAITGESEERIIDAIQDEENSYLIFELPGFNEEDVSINIKGAIIEIIVKKKNVEEIKDYLAERLSHGFKYSRKLPNFISTKDYGYTLKNGVLEIKFGRNK